MVTKTVSQKQIRKHLANGDKFKLEGSDQEKKHLVQSIVYGFINQRKAAAKLMTNREYALRLTSTLYFIEQKFQLIENYNYWRHCLELMKAKDLIYFCLPSENGKHKRIRLTMIGLIDRATEVATENKKNFFTKLAQA